jgi:hypothetical protein
VIEHEETSLFLVWHFFLGSYSARILDFACLVFYVKGISFNLSEDRWAAAPVNNLRVTAL